jgi:altronate dehydratase large subunit
LDKLTGYKRSDGKVGIRNYVVIIPSVACANGVVNAINRGLPDTVPLFHGHGCGRGGSDLEVHMRTLMNLGKHPNVAAVLVVGLGCEVIKPEYLASTIAESGKEVRYISVQETGGSQKAAARGIEIAGEMLAKAAQEERVPIDYSDIILGLECGGSDAFSGITANAAVGLASDWMVENGGTVILTENTEMIGTKEILKKRAASEKVAQDIEQMIDRAQQFTYDLLGPMADYVIAPGNMDGGMSSIQEKSLGCIAKAGSSTIHEVVPYACCPEKKGLILMDAPGYDTESMAGLAAGGTQLMVFTTGRGNPLGFPIVPVIKVASTSKLFNHMEDDMDINAGLVLEGSSLEETAEEIKAKIIKVINGQLTKAEVNQQNGIICLYTSHAAF